MSGYGRVAAAAILWGCWAVFLRPSGFDGPASAFILFAVYSAGIPFGLRGANFRDRGAWIALGLLGVFDAGNAWLYFAAVKQGPLAVGVLSHYLAPLLVALGAPWVTGERRSMRALLSTPLSLAGLAVVLWGGAQRFALSTALLGAGSAVFYGALVLAAKRASRAFSGLAVTALHAPVSMLTLVVLFRSQVFPVANGRAWGWAIAGACVCGLLATSLFNAGLKQVPAQAASALTYLEPVAAAIIGWAIFGEALSSAGMLGAAVVLACGAWVVTEPTPAGVATAPEQQRPSDG